MNIASNARTLFGPAVLKGSIRGLGLRAQLRNPIILMVWVSAWLGLLLTALSAAGVPVGDPVLNATITTLLWLTVLLSNWVQSVSLDQARRHGDLLGRSGDVPLAYRLDGPTPYAGGDPVPASELLPGDLVLVRADQMIPADGQVAAGVATVDESVVTGESAPVVRDHTEERRKVLAGTRVASDWLVIRVTSAPEGSFLDRIRDAITGIGRQRTPSELALTVFVIFLAIFSVVTVVTLLPITAFGAAYGGGEMLSLMVIFGLLVCLLPTTIGALLNCIGASGLSRLADRDIVADDAHVLEAAGDVDVVIFDKTGTLTLGNREANRFLAAPGVGQTELAEAAGLASLADHTPEGRSILKLAQETHSLALQDNDDGSGQFVPFTAETRMSGIDRDGRSIRKGAPGAIGAYVERQGGAVPEAVTNTVREIASAGDTPLLVADGARVLGAVALHDTLKADIHARVEDLHRLGVRTVMITGDSALTAATIAAEVGVQDFVAEAAPEDKLQLVRKEQANGAIVAMCGDGANDAPALAQANVGMAMGSGTETAGDAGNLLDLDGDPAKIRDVIGIGRQVLMARGGVTTFGLANDVARFFVLVPIVLAMTFPALGALNVLGLGSPQSALVAAVVFNALMIPLLSPVALRGVHGAAFPPSTLLRNNLLLYGAGGLVLPVLGIKGIDLAIVSLGLF